MHAGGIFSTRTLEREGDEAQALLAVHREVLRALGKTTGPTHSEFIRAHENGQFLFLESAARVGGAYIAEVTEAASGVNPWIEWARMECAQMAGGEYRLPVVREEYAGSVICLARQEWPDMASYDAAGVVYRLNKRHHAGLIVRSASAAKVGDLLGTYQGRFFEDFYARLDAPEKPTS